MVVNIVCCMNGLRHACISEKNGGSVNLTLEKIVAEKWFLTRDYIRFCGSNLCYFLSVIYVASDT